MGGPEPSDRPSPSGQRRRPGQKKAFPPDHAKGTRAETRQLSAVLDAMFDDVPSVMPAALHQAMNRPSRPVTGGGNRRGDGGGTGGEGQDEDRGESGLGSLGGGDNGVGGGGSREGGGVCPVDQEAWRVRLKHNVCMVGLHETSRQVAAHCTERGALIAHLAEQAGELLEALPRLYDGKVRQLTAARDRAERSLDTEVGALRAEVKALRGRARKEANRTALENEVKVAELNEWNIEREVQATRQRSYDASFLKHLEYRADAEHARVRVQKVGSKMLPPRYIGGRYCNLIRVCKFTK